MKSLTVATTSAAKIHEVRLALGDLPDWVIESLPEGVPGVEETGTTFIENAILKAIHYSRFVNGLALADDSGLCVESLDGRPGVWTARFGITDEERNKRVLDELAELGDFSIRDAAFHCAFVVARTGIVVWSTDATLQGQITVEPAGTGGFGFDPIFLVPGLRKTLAQLTTEEKNRISARGQALTELRHFLTTR